MAKAEVHKAGSPVKDWRETERRVLINERFILPYEDKFLARKSGYTIVKFAEPNGNRGVVVSLPNGTAIAYDNLLEAINFVNTQVRKYSDFPTYSAVHRYGAPSNIPNLA